MIVCYIILNMFPSMAQLDNAADSDSEERGFESLWAGQNKASTLVVGVLLFDSKGIRTRSPSRIGSPWRRCEGHKMRRFAKRTNSCGARIPLGGPKKHQPLWLVLLFFVGKGLVPVVRLVKLFNSNNKL